MDREGISDDARMVDPCDQCALMKANRAQSNEVVRLRRELDDRNRQQVDPDYLWRLKFALGDSNADSDADEVVAWVQREHEALTVVGLELGSDDLSAGTLLRGIRDARSGNDAVVSQLRSDLDRANSRVKTLELRLALIRLTSEGRAPK